MPDKADGFVLKHSKTYKRAEELSLGFNQKSELGERGGCRIGRRTIRKGNGREGAEAAGAGRDQGRRAIPAQSPWGREGRAKPHSSGG